MTQRVELRKHGPFDLRYGVTRLKAAPPSLRRPGAAELDWHDFRAQFFPESRRHDSDALAAYESYQSSSLPRRTTAKGASDEETLGALPPVALLVWEWEGGAGSERPRPLTVPEASPLRR